MIPFLSAGFRPFFLFAGLYGTFPIVVWIAALTGQATLPGPMSPVYWHGHEMVFGFGVAGMTGFLLTAIPSWTSSPPVKGRLLAFLAILWLLGRAAMWVGWGLGAWTVAITDVSLLSALVVVLGGKVIANGQRRNYPLLVLIVTMLVANVLMHLQTLGLVDGSGAIGLRLGVYVFSMLVAMIGGRVIPAFTANVLNMRGDRSRVESRPLLEKLTLLSLPTAIILDLAAADTGPWRTVAGIAALITGVILLLRMSRWRTFKILNEPILWVLHMGHFWLVIGFILSGLSDLTGLITQGAAIHALSAGAMGTMIMAMASRASLGHTGRPMKAPPAIVLAYVLVILGALLRVTGPTLGGLLGGGDGTTIIIAGGLLWVSGFALFSIVYWPILTQPRLGS